MIFVDTSFWVALRNRRDHHHQEAASLLKEHSKEVLVTTNHVCGESWTYFRRRAGHAAAVDFIESVTSSKRIDLSRVTSDQEKDAIHWLRQHDEREYSFVDATSFAYMRSRKITTALAFDGDFSAAGFIELRM